MKTEIRKILGIFVLAFSLILSACGNNDEDMGKKEKNHENMNNEEMNHEGSGEVPHGLREAKNPTFKVGNKAFINAEHMKGMKGAEATIIGAYETTAYVVSYTPTTGGKKVNDHKWVIQEEIKNADRKTLKPKTKVTLNADHMKGMNGANAVIDSSEKTTVYMVDYMPTTGGKKVTNHKWVTESELSAE